MSSPNDPTDPNISRTPEYPPQPEYYAQAPGYPTYTQGNPPTQPAQPYPYPQPAPQPYPPYQPYPGQYAPPPMPPKRSNRTLWIVLGSVGGALLLICGVCTFAAIALGGQIGKQFGPAFGAAYTVGTFCAAEQEQDYTTAYAQFSSNLQNQITSDQFAGNAATQDTENGKVTNCATDSSDPNGTSISDNQVTFTLRIQRADGPTTTGSVTLVKDGGDFKIDSLDSSLGLT
ncbi:MAG TPA: hypothetical protein VH349_15265 [Ktedonobacterales bacterium]